MKDVDPIQVLEDELVTVVSEATGLRPEMAVQYVTPMLRHLQQQYGGDTLYIPVIRREYPVDSIRDHLAASGDVQATMHHFGLSRSTLYRILRQAD